MRFPRVAFALGLFSAGVAFAGVNEWTPTGAPGGSATAIAFHPTSPGVVLAAAGWGIYRSINTGQSWTSVYEDWRTGGATSIVWDPANPSRVMAANANRLLRSNDGGLHFAEISKPAGGDPRKLVIAADGNGSVLYTATYNGKVFRTVNFGATWEDRSGSLPSAWVTDIVVSPQAPDTVYVLLQVNGLFRSRNGGLSWEPLAVNPFVTNALYKLAIDPSNPSHLLLATDRHGLLESRDGGDTWTLEDAGRYLWVGYHHSGTGAAMAISWVGPIIRRADRDAAWTSAYSLNGSEIVDAAFDPHDADAMASSSLLLATDLEPKFTTDGGASFTVRSQGLRGAEVAQLAAARDGTIYAGYRKGPAGIHRRTAGVWAPADNAELVDRLGTPFVPGALATDPSNALIVLAGSGAHLVRSQDGGSTWSTLNGPSGVRALTFDRSNSQLVYAASDGSGMWRSVDAGLSWEMHRAGLPFRLGAVAIDPQNSATLYAGGAEPAAPATQPPIYKTTDGGAIWDGAGPTLEVAYVQKLAVDPSNSQIVYAGGFGLVKSLDAGLTWQGVGAPIDDSVVHGFEVDPVVPTTLYMTADPATGGAARSVDGGATWEDLPQGVLGLSVLGDLVLDPQHPGQIIASVPHYGLVEFSVQPDLEATITPPQALGLGSADTATVRVANHGPFAASAVRLALTLPAGVTAAVPAPPQGTCARVGSGIECSFGAVRMNQTIDTVVTLTGGATAAAGALAASVSAREPDSALANNSPSVSLPVARVSNVSVTIASSAAAVDPGSAVTFIATATNNGPNDSLTTDVVVDLSGFTAQGASASQGTCLSSGSRATCSLGSLANAAQASVTVSAVASGAAVIGATATISTASIDTAAANNTATVGVTTRSLPPPATPTPAPAASSGGGGGAAGLVELLALLAAWLAWLAWPPCARLTFDAQHTPFRDDEVHREVVRLWVDRLELRVVVGDADAEGARRERGGGGTGGAAVLPMQRWAFGETRVATVERLGGESHRIAWNRGFSRCRTACILVTTLVVTRARSCG